MTGFCTLVFVTMVLLSFIRNSLWGLDSWRYLGKRYRAATALMKHWFYSQNQQTPVLLVVFIMKPNTHNNTLETMGGRRHSYGQTSLLDCYYSDYQLWIYHVQENFWPWRWCARAVAVLLVSTLSNGLPKCNKTFCIFSRNRCLVNSKTQLWLFLREVLSRTLWS